MRGYALSAGNTACVGLMLDQVVSPLVVDVDRTRFRGTVITDVPDIEVTGRLAREGDTFVMVNVACDAAMCLTAPGTLTFESEAMTVDILAAVTEPTGGVCPKEGCGGLVTQIVREGCQVRVDVPVRLTYGRVDAEE